jgi:hypothetical protein
MSRAGKAGWSALSGGQGTAQVSSAIIHVCDDDLQVPAKQSLMLVQDQRFA